MTARRQDDNAPTEKPCTNLRQSLPDIVIPLDKGTGAIEHEHPTGRHGEHSETMKTSMESQDVALRYDHIGVYVPAVRVGRATVSLGDCCLLGGLTDFDHLNALEATGRDRRVVRASVADDDDLDAIRQLTRLQSVKEPGQRSRLVVRGDDDCKSFGDWLHMSMVPGKRNPVGPSQVRRLSTVPRTLLACLMLLVAVACSAPPPEQPRPDRNLSQAAEAGETACVHRPSQCGYPDDTNTGVPAGIETRPSRSLTLSEPGQVVDGLEIHGEVNIVADNVTIKNSRITGGRGVGNADWVVVIRPGVSTVRIEDSEILTPAGSPQDIACILNLGDAKPTISRVNIHSCSAGISSGGGEVTDSYIHGMAEVKGLSHDVGIASNGGGGMTIRHNTVLNQLGQTAAVAFYQDFGPQRDNLVEDNLLAGGGYCVYGGAGQKGPTRNIRIVNNRFSSQFHANCGYYGVIASFNAHDEGNEFAGNYWDETGDDVQG